MILSAKGKLIEDDTNSRVVKLLKKVEYDKGIIEKLGPSFIDNGN
jgi:hypothetical protein